MTLISQTIDRLTEAKADIGLNLVAGAAEFAALKNNPPRHQMPAAYVLPTTDRAGPSELVGKHRQRVTRGLAVVVAVGNLRDDRGDSAAREMEILEAALLSALAGWTPTGAIAGMQFASSRTLGLRDQVVWRQFDFTVATKLQP